MKNRASKIGYVIICPIQETCGLYICVKIIHISHTCVWNLEMPEIVEGLEPGGQATAHHQTYHLSRILDF